MSSNRADGVVVTRKPPETTRCQSGLAMVRTIMKRLALALLLVTAPVMASLDVGPTGSSDRPTVLFWRSSSALAQTRDASPREAFEATKELDTIEAWEAFLANFPTGFYADLARAYLKKHRDARTAPSPGATVDAAPKSESGSAGNLDDIPPTDPGKPAVTRGGRYMGFAERFNRYYTDPAWRPSRVVYVSPSGSGDGASRDRPTSVSAAIQAARPGTKIHFLRGNYRGCFEFTKANSGTYDQPVVLYAERNEDRTLGVALTCCNSGRQTCFNLEAADYVAVDGFELIGGNYGVRAIGTGYPASQHSRGVAVIDCRGHDQERDPFFSGQADWAVWERNVAYGAKAGDGHGIYLSNGGDWNIVRYNETYGNVSSDFQINADPDSTCKEVGIAFNDPRCDAYAGTGEGGQGASDYFLVDSNYFHHGVGPGSVANFTSVRRSVIRNNFFGFYPRHGGSFWQETDNPKLGSSDNKILHNLFITTGRHALQFINHSTRNEFANNILLGVRGSGAGIAANPSATLMEVDSTVGENVYRSNLYVAGKIEGRAPNGTETAVAIFAADWFAKFPTGLNHDPNDFKPTARAPHLGKGALLPGASADRYGTVRKGQVELGPIEVP
ncbi:MAG: hypothetical protein AB7K78_23120 [Xanthobacteraceae bacterium]